MRHTSLRELYENRRLTFSRDLATINKRINLISNARLATAIGLLALLYLGFSTPALFYTVPIGVILFVLLVRRHASLFDQRAHLVNLVRVQANELRILDGDFSVNDSGTEFADVHHPYAHDLDLFGEGSLFQYVNRCSTQGGKHTLAQLFTTTPATAADVHRRQEAAKELVEKLDFRHEVQALTREVGERADDQRQLREWLRQPSFIYGKSAYRYMLIISPAITTSLVVSAFFVEGVSGLALLAAGFQWVFLGFHLRRVNAFHEYISRKKNTLEKYARILSRIRAEAYTSPLMQELQVRAQDADETVKRLASLVRAFDARLNFMTNLAVNGLFLYDLQCVLQLERWKATHAARLPGWLDTIRETEMLCSLGTFTFNHPGFTFPVINTERKLAAKAMAHPLIDENVRVENDVALDAQQSIMIITGANMAGKSTFLRALGVNIILGLAGAPVCAKDFDCPLIELRSGMRTADSLRENQSYFYAELHRLKSIIDDLRAGTPLLILLDEILKGTNSTDKQAGSLALVKQLTTYPCLVLIATHDLVLGDLERIYPDRIRNYCFEANIEGDQLHFDYKLNRGLAQRMNATFLMQKMGIITPPRSPGEEATPL